MLKEQFQIKRVSCTNILYKVSRTGQENQNRRRSAILSKNWKYPKTAIWYFLNLIYNYNFQYKDWDCKLKANMKNRAVHYEDFEKPSCT